MPGALAGRCHVGVRGESVVGLGRQKDTCERGFGDRSNRF